MSAWVVNREHVDLLVSAGLRGPRGRAVSPDNAWHELRWFAVPYGDLRAGGLPYREAERKLDYSTADAVGQMLVMEVVASVSFRYPDDVVAEGTLPGPTDPYYLEPYTWRDPGYRLDAGEIFQAIGCYRYQACEHDDWPRSEAAQFCEALRDRVCATLYAGPWGWDAQSLQQAGRAAVLS